MRKSDKLNAAKSKYSPGPAPKSNTAKWEAFQGGVKLTVETLWKDADAEITLLKQAKAEYTKL